MFRTLVFFALLAASAAMWVNNGRAKPEATHTVILAVKQPANAADTCDSMLMDISDPHSRNYGKQKTLGEVNRAMLDLNRVRKVESWLSARGYRFSTVGDYIKVTGRIAQLETLLGARFNRYEHKQMTGRTFYVAEDHTVPAEVSSSVLSVRGGA